MVASLTPLTRRAALGLALLPALRRPAVAADLKDIVSTPSGLRYVDFAPGSGAPPRFGQLVRFHYVGYIASEDGESLEAYDSSYERNTPYFTKHGNGLTCEGLEEALQPYRACVLEMEEQILRTPELSLPALQLGLSEYELVLPALCQLVATVRIDA